MKNSLLWKGLTAVFACLLSFAIFMTVLCNTWEGYINVALGIRPPVVEATADTMVYKTEFSDDGTLSDAALEKMLAASDEHDKQTMEEGAVLVKNDNNALPFASDERKVTLFGRAVADPVYRGNSGGASADKTRLVNLYSALKAEGFSINDTLYNAYADSDVKRTKGKDGWNIGEVPKSFYTDALKNSYATNHNDAAIVMFSRDGGEGNDLPRDYNGKSYLALQAEEADLLEMIKSSGKFEKTVVLINSAYPMELGFVQEDKYGVDACLWIGGAGLKGFNGVASLLAGKADPSGHFVDTYAADSLSAPAVRNFGDFKYTNAADIKADSAQAYVIQAEGIYVGYKYYETRYQDQVLGINSASGGAGKFASTGDGWNYAEEMAYPFGYGTSYANFTQTIESFEWDREKHEVTVTVKVVNNGVPQGSAYTGKSKSVVQLYVQLPYEKGMAQKSAIQLVDFAKTKPLGAGDEDTVTIVADDYLFATYDENATNGKETDKKGCYVFDKGDYFFAIGDDSHDALNNVLAAREKTGMFDIYGNAVSGDADKVRKDDLAALDNTTYAASRETGEVVCNRIQYADINSYGDFVKYLDRSDWNTYPKTYSSIAATEAMIDDLIGEKYVKANNAPAYAGSQVGIAKGIKLYDMKDVEYTDDAKWDEFLRQMSLSELCSIIGEKFGQPAITSIGKFPNVNSDGPSGPQGNYAYGNKGSSTMHVNEVVAASTYNKEILNDRGRFIGEDCLFVGTTQLWGPGANLHRTPFSGRNYEYYSEDSIMSYICGSVQCAAMQAKGVNTAIKHFCANDQETNRTGLSTFMTEQTYRQGALKGFEGALTKGGALSFMMAMPRIGCKIMYENDETLTQVVRKEWGFTGVNITDSAISQHCFGTIESLMAGTDTFNADAGRANEVQKHIVANKDGAVLERVLEVNKSFYYSMLRSNNINGLTHDTEVEEFVPWWSPVLIAICCLFGVATVACAVMFALSRFVFGKKEAKE